MITVYLLANIGLHTAENEPFQVASALKYVGGSYIEVREGMDSPTIYERSGPSVRKMWVQLERRGFRLCKTHASRVHVLCTSRSVVETRSRKSMKVKKHTRVHG